MVDQGEYFSMDLGPQNGLEGFQFILCEITSQVDFPVTTQEEGRNIFEALKAI